MFCSYIQKGLSSFCAHNEVCRMRVEVAYEKVVHAYNAGTKIDQKLSGLFPGVANNRKTKNKTIMVPPQ